MACNITQGRTFGCRDKMGGIKAIYLFNYGDAQFTKAATDEITAIGDIDVIGTDVTAYEYKLKTSSGLTQNIQSSIENGTVFYEQVLNLVLQSMSKEDNEQVKLLAWGRPQIVVSDYNNDGYLIGRVNGAEVTGGSITTGVAYGDLNGYSLDLTANERFPANFIEGFNGALANPFADPVTGTNLNVILG